MLDQRTIEAIYRGWPVLSILLITSIITLTVMIERYIYFKKTSKKLLGMIAGLKRIFTDAGPGCMDDAKKFLDKYSNPISTGFKAVFSDTGNVSEEKHAEKEDIMREAIQIQTGMFERSVSILATVGSITPFIGLFGTVIGVIKSFQALGTSLTGGPGVVAVGISEALIATATGLGVAIPAVVLYNFFVGWMRRIHRELSIGCSNIIRVYENLKVNK